MSQPQPADTPKILLVDDAPGDLAATHNALAPLDCELIEVRTGAEALQTCVQHEFALILLDVEMPDMDGFEVAAVLAGSGNRLQTPIIFLTVDVNDDIDKMTAYELGGVDYIVKPINEFILRAKTKIFLELYKSRQALKRAESLARHEATHDPLTQLPNRSLFEDRLATGIARAQRENQMLALVYVDIDRFKPVNDVHGHRAGDLLLIAIADRLRGKLRACDTVARLGGDEFAVILEQLDDADDVGKIAAKLSLQLEQPFELRGSHAAPISVAIGASTGYALYPHDGNDAAELVACADMRMYQMKHAARSR